MTNTGIFNVWRGMLKRCHLKTDPNFKNYGARGIYVCDKWRAGFINFYQDMGATYLVGLSIERKDNDGPYSPENCRWATVLEQGKNKRNNRVFTARNKTMIASEWARELGISVQAVLQRSKTGWTEHEVCTVPPVH